MVRRKIFWICALAYGDEGAQNQSDDIRPPRERRFSSEYDNKACGRYMSRLHENDGKDHHQLRRIAPVK